MQGFLKYEGLLIRSEERESSSGQKERVDEDTEGGTESCARGQENAGNHASRVSKSRVMKGLGRYGSFPLGNRDTVAFVKGTFDGETREAERLLCARKKAHLPNLGQRREDELGKITLCPFK